MNNQKKLVVIGGGFAGSLVAKKLESHFQTTLIDKKDCFEFTPGILRAIVDPTHLKRIQVCHKDYFKKTKIIKASVKNISKTHVFYDNKKIKYDYLVIASGSSYHSPIKSHNVVDSSNARLLKKNYEKLCKAKNILIIGGGIVGVELAAEIAERYHNEIKQKQKVVTLVHSQSRLMPREKVKVSNIAEEFLTSKRVNIVFNKKIDLNEKAFYEFNSPDMILIATGIKPNSGFMKKDFKTSLENDYIKVNSYLQLENQDNIFVAGDVTNIKEEKLAQNAEEHALTVINNILNLENHVELKKYQSKKHVVVISLGKIDGIFVSPNFIFSGVIPGILKQLIEKWIIFKYKH